MGALAPMRHGATASPRLDPWSGSPTEGPEGGIEGKLALDCGINGGLRTRFWKNFDETFLPPEFADTAPFYISADGSFRHLNMLDCVALSLRGTLQSQFLYEVRREGYRTDCRSQS